MLWFFFAVPSSHFKDISCSLQNFFKNTWNFSTECSLLKPEWNQEQLNYLPGLEWLVGNPVLYSTQIYQHCLCYWNAWKCICSIHLFTAQGSPEESWNLPYEPSCCWSYLPHISLSGQRTSGMNLTGHLAISFAAAPAHPSAWTCTPASTCWWQSAWIAIWLLFTPWTTEWYRAKLQPNGSACSPGSLAAFSASQPLCLGLWNTFPCGIFQHAL